METITRKVHGCKKHRIVEYELRPGMYLDSDLSMRDWAGYNSKGDFIACANSKEELIKKLISIEKQKDRKSIKEQK